MHAIEGGPPYRVDVEAAGETTWASNARRFASRGEAEEYARDLAARWTLMVGWRVVPATTPERQPIE